MSRSITPIASQAPVAPGTQVVIPVYTDTGFSAGDYVYTSTNNSVGFPRSASINLPTTGYIIASTLTQSTQTTTGQQACYGPLGPPQAVYSGTSSTAGTVVSTTVLENIATGSNCCAMGLTGGNIAVAWQSGTTATVKYAVYGPDGVTVVKAATVVNGNLYTSVSALVGLAAMSNGNFYVFYVNSSGQQIHYRYNNVGTNIDGPTIWGPAIYSSGYVLAASFAGGVGFSNFTGSGYYGILNNGAGQTYFSLGPSGNGAKAVLIGLIGTNSNTMYAISISNSLVVNWESRLISSGTAISSGTFTPNAGGSAAYGFSGCALSTGNFMFIYYNTSGNLTANIYTPGGANAGTPTLLYSYVMPSAGFSIAYEIYAVATPSGFMVFSIDGSTNLNYITGTLGTSGYTFTNGNLGLTNSATQQYGITGGGMANGNIVIGYRGTTAYPTITTLNSQTFVNGTTLLAGSGSYAAPSYVLLGVAANTAAAGSTGSVVINGPAALNTNYPSVTTPITFDYTGQGVFGNKGTVAGRSVNLRGLE
jgi:hypothetical protein